MIDYRVLVLGIPLLAGLLWILPLLSDDSSNLREFYSSCRSSFIDNFIPLLVGVLSAITVFLYMI